MPEDFTAKFKVDISDLKKNITEATKQIKLANATFKSETAGMDKWSKDADGLSKKLEQLKTVLAGQKSILAAYKSQLAEQQKAYEENGKRADQLKAKLQELASQGVAKTSDEYKGYQKALREVVKEQENNGKAVDDLNLQILEQEAAVGNTERSIRYYSQSLETLQEEQRQAAEEANRQKTAYENLEDTIADQQSRLDALKAEYSNVVVEQGKNSSSAKNLAGEIDKLSGELADNKKALSEADKAADDLDKSLDEIEPEKKASGYSVLTGALANLVANGIQLAISGLKDFATETINVGKQFDSSMSNVAALSGATGDELQMLRDTAKEFGSTTQFSASEAADALGYMALAGWDANQSADALGGVLNLAAASGMDLASASDMVTDYMSAFGMEASESAKFADMLAFAQANANTTAEGLGEAFKNSAANMNAAGQDIETVTSLLSMMANQGLKGSEAGTALTAIMRDMTAKMKDGAIAIGDTTVQVMDANGNYRDMTDILTEVEAATNGMGDAQKASALSSTFTADSIKGLNLILNAGVGEAAKFEEQLRNSSGSAKEMADIMNDNLSGDLTAFGSKLEGVQIALYEKFEPALRSGVDALSGLLDGVQWLIDHSDIVIAALAGMAAGVGAYIAYTTALTVMKNGWMALEIVQKAVTAAQWLMNAAMSANPIGIVIGLVAGLVTAFVVLWKRSEKFREFWLNLWKQIKEAVKPVVEAIVQWFSETWEKVKAVWGVVVQWFSDVWTGIKNVFSVVGVWFKTIFTTAWTNIKNAWSVVVKWFTNIWTSIKTAFAVVPNWFKTIFTTAWNNIKAAWSGVKTWFSNLWTGIKNIFSGVGTWFKTKFQTAWTNIKNVFSGWSKFFSGLWDKIKNTFSGLGTKLGDAIGGAVKAGINRVIGWIESTINRAIGLINGAINLINKLPGVNIGKVSTLSLPRLAQGGVLKRGQVGILEGSGAEAVVPLERNKQWIRAVANEMRREMFGAAGGSGVSGGNQARNPDYNFTQIINAPKQPSRIELYRQTRNLLNLAKYSGGV